MKETRSYTIPLTIDDIWDIAERYLIDAGKIAHPVQDNPNKLPVPLTSRVELVHETDGTVIMTNVPEKVDDSETTCVCITVEFNL